MQISHLSVLLAAQLGLAGVLWYSNNQQTEPEPLLATTALTELTLQKGPGSLNTDAKPAGPEATAQQFSLRNIDGKWQFNAGSAQQPLWLAADPAKMQQLLSDLQKARLNWPLADSVDSHHRFAVSAEEYQWQLRLKAAGTDAVQTLWLGNSAGLRQQYLRRDGETAVYQVALNSYELSVEPNQWLDKHQLALADIKAVRGPDYHLFRATTGDRQGWQLTGLAPMTGNSAALPALQQNAADQLLRQLQTLTVQQYQPDVSAAAEQALKQAKPIVVTAGNSDGTSADFSVQLARSGDQYLIRRADLAAVFSIDQGVYDQLVNTNLAALSSPGAPAGPNSGQQMLSDLHRQLQPGQTAQNKAFSAASPQPAAVGGASPAPSAEPD